MTDSSRLAQIIIDVRCFCRGLSSDDTLFLLDKLGELQMELEWTQQLVKDLEREAEEKENEHYRVLEKKELDIKNCHSHIAKRVLGVMEK